MKKTFTINISGNIFHIEEDAFEKLQGYLQKLKGHFGSGAEGREIVADIEARIAELFLEKGKGENNVVTIEWIDEVISVMGAPEDFLEEEGGAEPSKSQSRKKKRLYRDPDSRFIAGVCSGLGAYFKVDPIIMRIIFLVLLLGNGIGLIAYLILWIAVPKAVTASQKLEMRGEEVNITNIEKTIRVDGADGKDDQDADASTAVSAASRVKKSQGNNGTGDFFSGLFKAVGIAIGIFLILIGFFGVIGFLSTIIVGQTFLSDWPLAWSSDVQFSGFFEHFVSKSTFAWGVILVSILALIPLLAILYAGTKLVFRYKSNNTAIGLGMVGIWLVALIAVIILGTREAGNYKSNTSLSGSETLYLNEDKILRISVGTDKYADYDAEDWDIDNVKVINVEGRTIFLGKPRFDIEKSGTNECVLVVKKRSRGRTPADANELIQKMNYAYQTSDSTLVLDPWFFLGENALWRNQQVDITLKLPEGMSVYLDENAERIIHDIENVSNAWDRDMVGKTWIMMPGGLTLLDSLKTAPKELNAQPN